MNGKRIQRKYKHNLIPRLRPGEINTEHTRSFEMDVNQLFADKFMYNVASPMMIESLLNAVTEIFYSYTYSSRFLCQKDDQENVYVCTGFYLSSSYDNIQVDPIWEMV